MAIIDYNIIRLIKILHILKYIIIIDYDITYLIKMFPRSYYRLQYQF